MRTLYRLLLRLYPHGVRSEFADEMLDVFDQACAAERGRGSAAYMRFCARELGGLVVTLLVQERSMKHKRLIMQGGIAGLLIGGVFAAAWNARPYTSTAVLRVVPAMIPERLVPAQTPGVLEASLPAIVQTVMSRSSLASEVTRYNLYPGERARMPMEDVIERMRKDLRISSVRDASFEVSFTYPDRMLAQKTTADFVSQIIGEYTRQRRMLAALTSQFLKDSAEKAGVAWEESLAKIRAAQAAAKPLDRVRLDADIARQRYESLSQKVAEAEMLGDLERRQQGQTLELLDPASLPVDSRPSVIFSSMLGFIAGGLIGWLISVGFARRAKEAVADAA